MAKPKRKPKAAVKPQAEPKPLAEAKVEPPPRPGRQPLKFKDIRLTQVMADGILEAIEKGAYPHQAARAYGIPSSVWYEWLKRGRGGLNANGVEAPERLVEFVHLVEEAAAKACLKASGVVFDTNPLMWLTKGPGRERPGTIGWADKAIPENADLDKPEKAEGDGKHSAVMALFERIKDRLTDDELADMMKLNREADTED